MKKSINEKNISKNVKKNSKSVMRRTTRESRQKTKKEVGKFSDVVLVSVDQGSPVSLGRGLSELIWQKPSK